MSTYTPFKLSVVISGKDNFLPLNIAADPIAVDIIRFMVKTTKIEGGRNAFTGLVTTEGSRNDDTTSDFLKKDVHGNLVIDFSRIQVGRWYRDQNSAIEKKLTRISEDAARNLCAEYIKKIVQKQYERLLKKIYDKKPEEYGSSTPLCVSMYKKRDERGNIVSLGYAEHLNQLPEQAKLSFTYDEIRCLYEMLKGRDVKKLALKYGDVYERFRPKQDNVIEATILSRLAQEIEATVNRQNSLKSLEYRHASAVASIVSMKADLRKMQAVRASLDKFIALAQAHGDMASVIQTAGEIARRQTATQYDIETLQAGIKNKENQAAELAEELEKMTGSAC